MGAHRNVPVTSVSQSPTDIANTNRKSQQTKAFFGEKRDKNHSKKKANSNEEINKINSNNHNRQLTTSSVATISKQRKNEPNVTNCARWIA